VDKVSGQTVEVAAERHDAHDAVHPSVITVAARLRISGTRRPGEGSLGGPTW
jgi:hypothetical protein